MKKNIWKKRVAKIERYRKKREIILGEKPTRELRQDEYLVFDPFVGYILRKKEA